MINTGVCKRCSKVDAINCKTHSSGLCFNSKLVQAAMLRPATAAERAVTSVLNDVSQAIHGAEEDLVINERQARALLSRIRRTAQVPDETNDLL